MRSHNAPPGTPPDERFKADLLLVVAHPDDETAVGPLLARLVYDERRRVAVLFTTRGNGGANAVGPERASALGAVREIEARRALASFGITNVWFIDWRVTPNSDVLQALAHLAQASALEHTVRVIRLTRPEVILTWLPAHVAGEHVDHEAAGVLATEAFAMAGDPTVYPAQVAQGRRDRGTEGYQDEGLQTWQPKKLYFFSDPLHLKLTGWGPTYRGTDSSISQGEPYYELALREASYHLTQMETGQVAAAALGAGGRGARAKDTPTEGGSQLFPDPARLVLGRSLVGGAPTAGLFTGIRPGSITVLARRAAVPRDDSGLTVQLGGRWRFYEEFWHAHGLERLAQLVTPQARVSEVAGSTVYIPLVATNGTDRAFELLLTGVAPPSWRMEPDTVRATIPAHGVYPTYFAVSLPTDGGAGWHEIAWHATDRTGKRAIASVTLHIH